MYDRAFLEKYFGEVWSQQDRTPSDTDYTGMTLVKEIRLGESVLDAGCGTNEYKKYLPDVYGIDITDIGADEVIAIEDFVSSRKFDVAFCLGSINFGDVDLIRRQIKAVVDSLKPNARIYWRCNPGYADHDNDLVHNIDFFPWTFGWHDILSEEFGFKLDTIEWERDMSRIYAVWIR